MFVEEYLVDLRRGRYRPGAWITYVRRCVAMSREQAFYRPETLRSLGVLGVLGFVFLLACAVSISLLINMRLAVEFFRSTGLLLLAGLVWIASHLRMLTDMEGRPLSRINAANVLTLSRLVSIPAFLVFAAGGETLLALITFVAGAATDVVDGWLARHCGESTPLGRVFDPIVDILFNGAVVWALYHGGLVPAWIVALVFTRYGLLLFGAAIIYIFKGPVEIKPTILGKATGVVMTLLVASLVAGAMLFGDDINSRIQSLMVLGLGFVEAITIPQVIFIGVYNFKRAGGRSRTALQLVEVRKRN
jgi:phosphatidylglycerophosphate synthase